MLAELQRLVRVLVGAWRRASGRPPATGGKASGLSFELHIPQTRVWEAYAFKSELPLKALFERLNAEGPWTWIERDSDWHGDYISTRAIPEYAMLKIFEYEERGPQWYVFNIKYQSDRTDALEELAALRSAILDTVLPLVDARDVEPTGYYE